MSELVSPPSWMADALCVGVPTRMYFPHRGKPPPQAIRDACHVCPHAVECLTFAIVEQIRFGQWGGIREQARAYLIRRGVYRTRAVTVRYTAGQVTIERHQPAPCTPTEARAALVALVADLSAHTTREPVAV